MKNNLTFLLSWILTALTTVTSAQKVNKVSLDFGAANFKSDISTGHTFLFDNSQEATKYTKLVDGVNGFSVSISLERKVNHWLSIGAAFQKIKATDVGTERIGVFT